MDCAEMCQTSRQLHAPQADLHAYTAAVRGSASSASRPAALSDSQQMRLGMPVAVLIPVTTWPSLR
jgi:hypothetical protein